MPAAQKPAFELELERIINAPRQLVFDAWAKPERMSQWFAPEPFTLTVHRMDFRPGGRFVMAMRAPDGGEFPFTGTYRRIEPPNKLMWTGEFPSGPADQITTTVTFTDQGGKTKVHVRQTFHVMTPEIEYATRGAEQGWNMTLDQLDRFCTASHAAEEEADREIVITRLLSAPPQAVFDAFSHPDRVARWWGPNGFTLTSAHMDFKPGGQWRLTMHGPDGRDYPSIITYLEIDPPHRIVYSQRGTDDGVPVSFTTTINIQPQADKTLITLHSLFPTAEQRNLVVEEYGAIEGGEQHLARLDAYLRNG